MHIEIAVCDDDENELKFPKSQIDTFMRSHNIEGNITLFSCGEDFLSAERGKLYDIVFMDVYMTEIVYVLERNGKNYEICYTIYKIVLWMPNANRSICVSMLLPI